jgi:orotate phosphoribosyltransferase
MKEYQRQFIDFAIEIGAIRFGEFKLKSGRVSPYFFNAGLFNTGGTLARLGEFYAESIIDAGLEFDMLYGPAYKGIPLVSTVSIALATRHGRDYPYAFNRKEIKDHAEGGIIVGAPITGKVLIIDDVVSSGMSTNEAVDIIHAQDGVACGLAIAVDRQERGEGEIAAVQEIEQRHGIPVCSIVKLETLIPYLRESDDLGHHVEAVEAYGRKYGPR